MKNRSRVEIRCRLMGAGILSLCTVTATAQFLGPAVTSPPATASAPASAAISPYSEIKIAPGDVISIATYGAPELTTTSQASSGGIVVGLSPAALQGVKVDSAGEISLPYLGSVRLAGLTAGEAAAYLKNALKQGGFLVDPQVSVQLVDSPTRAITVIGEVMKPSPIPAFGQIRLLDAISACGGFTALASHDITIRRLGNPDPISIELGTDAKGASAGEKGMSFKRGPAVQASDCGAMATPLPASTAAIRLLTLSCSSAMRGLLLRVENIAARFSCASG